MVRGVRKNRARLNERIIAYWYSSSMITCKLLEYCRMAGCLFELASGGISGAKGPQAYRSTGSKRKTDAWGPAKITAGDHRQFVIVVGSHL
jgi:hypothetical protein